MAAPQSQERLRSALRVVLALSAFGIYFGDPSEHPGRRPFALAVLFAFVAYSLAMYLVAVRRERYLPLRAAPWIDVGWVTLLVAVSAGTSSIFYPLYLFAIHYASFGGGFRRGMAVALASVVSFAGVGVLTAPRGPSFAVDPYFIRPLYLLVLGYLTAVWGGHELRSRARLALLRDVTALSNPRFGIERTIARLLEAVRGFYDADACRLVVAEEPGARRWMRGASRGNGGAIPEVALPPDVAEVLLPPVGVDAFCAHARRRGDVAAAQVVDAAGLPASEPAREAARALLAALDAGALLSVPFRYHANAVARLHVSRAAATPFDRGDLDFLRHVLDQIVPVLESIRLVDRLASDAADEERRRIARDLHDSVIQPYLGLRLGLSAAEKALSGGRVEEGRAHLARLAQLADGEIETLRGYVRALRDGAAASGVAGGLLEAGVRRFCSRFSDATGIRVEVASEGPPVRNERLAAEVFQMVAEGLSNVRRHTSATRAEVRIRSADDLLRVTIANDAATTGAPSFFPRSLGERAAALGGNVRVEPVASGTTAVHVEIPL